MAKLGELISQIDGRLTLTTGTPVTTSDVTAATSLYFTPYKGNHIALYNDDFSEWRFYEFDEVSYSLSGKAADTNYDVFLYDDAGTLTQELVAWSDATTRATALAVQDGVYVKSSEPAKRYLGTFRTTSTTGQCEDSGGKRYCWNYYNRVNKRLHEYDETQHTYSTGTWRAWNNDSTIRVELVVGIVEDAILLNISGDIDTANDSDVAGIGLGYDTSTTRLSNSITFNNYNNQLVRGSSSFVHQIELGYHYYQAVEIGSSNSPTFGRIFINTVFPI